MLSIIDWQRSKSLIVLYMGKCGETYSYILREVYLDAIPMMGDVMLSI